MLRRKQPESKLPAEVNRLTEAFQQLFFWQEVLKQQQKELSQKEVQLAHKEADLIGREKMARELENFLGVVSLMTHREPISGDYVIRFTLKQMAHCEKLEDLWSQVTVQREREVAGEG
jgi:hypothetical protein